MLIHNLVAQQFAKKRVGGPTPQTKKKESPPLVHTEEFSSSSVEAPIIKPGMAKSGKTPDAGGFMQGMKKFALGATLVAAGATLALGIAGGSGDFNAPRVDSRANAAIEMVESNYQQPTHHQLATDMARVVQDSEDGNMGDYQPRTTAGSELARSISSDFEHSPKHTAARQVADYLQVDQNHHDGDISTWAQDGYIINK